MSFLKQNKIENGTDLALFITYGQPNKSASNNNDNEEKSISDKDAILLEYDPLMNHKSNVNEEKKSSSSSPMLMEKQSYRFILSYNEMTEQFITQLQHVVTGMFIIPIIIVIFLKLSSHTVSHRTFTESIDFLWTKQYFQQIPLQSIENFSG